MSKQQGIEQVSRNNTAFLTATRGYARRYCKRKGEVTVDNIRAWAMQKGIWPNSSHAWGAIFSGNNWKLIDRRPSVIPSNRGREIKVWKWAA